MTRTKSRYDVPLKYRLRSWLDRQHRDQKWLATKVGIDASYLTMILSGRRTPSLQVAVRLEEVTGIEAMLFLQERGE